MTAYKDSIAETERVKERKRVGVERGAGECACFPGTEMMSRWRFDASGGDIREPTSTKRTE